MAVPSKVKGRGMYYVKSRITNTESLDEKTFLKWYTEDHIPEVIQTSGINSAMRFKHADPTTDMPYLAIYPMEDVSFTQQDEFKNIGVHSDILPKGGPVYDLVDFDVRVYALYSAYDPTKSSETRVKTLLTAGYNLGSNITEQDYDDWYEKEHIPLVAKVAGFSRVTRFKLVDYHNNQNLLELKGLSTGARSEAVLPPEYINLFEFDVESPDMPTLLATAETEWAKKIMGGSKVEAGYYHLEGAFGDRKFLH